MPEICRFYGIIIRMYFSDHNPPHFHAIYGNAEVVIAIESLGVIVGELPPRAMGLVMEWASLRHENLRKAWQHASKMQPIERIEPLS